MNKLLKDPKAILFFVLPAFLIYSTVVLYPIIQSFIYSLVKWNGFGDMKFVGFKNYIALFINNKDMFPQSVLNSFKLVAASVFIQLPIALTFALILANGIKGESFFRTVYFIPVILPSIVIGQLWKNIYYPTDIGLLNYVLQSIGLEQYMQTWLGQKETAMNAAIVPIVWQFIGQHMLLFYAGIKSIPKQINEAALIDGASGIQRTLRITLPLLKPTIRVSLIWAVTGSFKAFDQIYVLTHGGPIHSSEVPSLLMYLTMFDKYRYGYGSSMAIFIIIMSLVFTWIIFKIFKTEKV